MKKDWTSSTRQPPNSSRPHSPTNPHHNHRSPRTPTTPTHHNSNNYGKLTSSLKANSTLSTKPSTKPQATRTTAARVNSRKMTVESRTSMLSKWKKSTTCLKKMSINNFWEVTVTIPVEGLVSSFIGGRVMTPIYQREVMLMAFILVGFIISILSNIQR